MSQIIKLNIGGVHYQTTWATLMRDSESMLARMIDQPNEKEKIKNGQELFIDRDGAAFSYVLNYLRSGDHVVLPTDQEKKQVLLQEADFYQLRGLINLIKHGGNFQVGDMVGINKSGADHLNLIFHSFPYNSRTHQLCCWECHKTIKFVFPDYAGQWSVKCPETIRGKILEVSQGCAVVGFPYSSLKFSIHGSCNGVFDTIVNIHMPLMHLIKK